MDGGGNGGYQGPSTLRQEPGGGAPNTGAGGGGAGTYNGASGVGQAGAAGGSGVVVIRYPAYLSAAASTTGSPVTYIAGPYRVYVFNSSGSITF
jgi:hypothetical protein